MKVNDLHKKYIEVQTNTLYFCLVMSFLLLILLLMRALSESIHVKERKSDLFSHVLFTAVLMRFLSYLFQNYYYTSIRNTEFTDTENIIFFLDMDSLYSMKTCLHKIIFLQMSFNNSFSYTSQI